MKYGFSFPREHGLIAFWSASLFFGLIMGLSYSLVVVDIILAILFSSSIILSYDSIKSMIKHRFRKINFVPLVTVLGTSLLVIYLKFSIYTIIFYALLGFVVFLWGYTNLKQDRLGYTELSLGTIAISLQFPIIFNILYPIDNLEFFLYSLATWWIYSGILLITIVNVGCYRGKIEHNRPIIIWILYLLSFIPMFLLNFLEPVAAILMLEPTWRGISQYYGKATLRSEKISIKTVGWRMVISIYLFIALVFFLSISGIHLTHKF